MQAIVLRGAPYIICIIKLQIAHRFSGRLPSKACEARLADECKLLGKLFPESVAPDYSVSNNSCPEPKELTLARLVRAIANGNLRRYIQGITSMLKVSDRFYGSFVIMPPSVWLGHIPRSFPCAGYAATG